MSSVMANNLHFVTFNPQTNIVEKVCCRLSFSQTLFGWLIWIWKFSNAMSSQNTFRKVLIPICILSFLKLTHFCASESSANVLNIWCQTYDETFCSLSYPREAIEFWNQRLFLVMVSRKSPLFVFVLLKISLLHPKYQKHKQGWMQNLITSLDVFSQNASKDSLHFY